MYYNPLNVEKDKSIQGCSLCTSLSGIVTRLCENYGCVAEEFVTNYAADDCNSVVVENINPVTVPLSGSLQINAVPIDPQVPP